MILVAIAAMVMSSCTEDTGSIGIPPANETLETSTATYNVYSRSMKIDSIPARSSASYLGAIYDPETNGRLTSSFLTQFSVRRTSSRFPQSIPLLQGTSRAIPAATA